MADVQRLQAAIIALYANNTSGDISPQDLRDLVVSIIPGWGGLYISTPVQTVIASGGTAVKMLGTTTAFDVQNFTHSNNKLLYDGAPTSRFFVWANVTFDIATGTDTVSVQLFKDGSLITGAESRSVNTAALPNTVSVMASVSLATNSYVEIYIENEDTTENIDTTQAQMFIIGLMGE